MYQQRVLLEYVKLLYSVTYEVFQLKAAARWDFDSVVFRNLVTSAESREQFIKPELP
jgi:hypothetical protein